MAASDAEPSGEPLARVSNWVWVRVIGLCGLALASVIWLKLALAVAFLTLVVFLSLPAAARAERRRLRIVVGVSALVSGTSSLMFVAKEAVPGIVAGGQRATAQAAVSQLREVLFAEDAMRKTAVVDPDSDGVGSAALIGELTGSIPVRGADRLSPPILQRRGELVDTRIGPALLSGGYIYVVCLPKSGGGWTARPADKVDEELAERRFLVYAWPSAAQRINDAFFLDEHETILTSLNLERGEPRYAGPNFPPPCDAALSGPQESEWSPWRGKKPRSGPLPGER